MKEITKERKTSYTVWEACDGTVFDCKEECLKYERTAEAVLTGRYNKLKIATENAWELLYGCEDNNIDVLKITSREDVDTVLQYFFVKNDYILKDVHKDRREHLEKLVTQALEEHDLFLMGRNYDDDPYILDTRNNIVRNLMKLDSLNKED